MVISWPVSVAVEGMVDAAVVQQLFEHYRLPLGPIYQAGSKQYLPKGFPDIIMPLSFIPGLYWWI
ncbi:MAG: hypothetical protein NZ602_07195 [Thermoguttaceae bacterium]|nr:hypothetical protein [Thermoguttaceae bacterium]MDW8038160.1 hypothetical protein [Thermoguttaceae bacterium]